MPRLRRTLSAFAALAALAAAAGLAPALGQSVNPSEEERLRNRIEDPREGDAESRGLRSGFEPEQDGARDRDRRNQQRAGRQSRNIAGRGTGDGIFVFEPLDPLRDPLRQTDPDAAQTVRRDPDRDDTAQRAEDDPYASLGVRMGSFLLYPELSVESEYDDNLFLTPSKTQGDWALVLTPSLQVQSNWSRHSLTATLSGERSYHERFSSEDEKTFSAGLTGQLDIRHNTYLVAAAHYSRFLEDRSETDFPSGTTELPRCATRTHRWRAIIASTASPSRCAVSCSKRISTT